MKALVLRLQADAGPGELGSWAMDRGVAMDVVDLEDGRRLPRPGNYDIAVVLGSDESWARDWSARMFRLLDWLRTAEEEHVSVLGICFGAQALAVAHGGKVNRLEEPEVAWIDLHLSAGVALPDGPWLSWHEDVISLPGEALELARTRVGPHAFQVECGIGVQFHPEVTLEIVSGWLDKGAGREPQAGIVSAEKLLEDTARNIVGNRVRAHRLFDQFVLWAAGRGG